MAQYKKEDPIVALYEMKRMMEPELGEKSVVEVVYEKLGNYHDLSWFCTFCPNLSNFWHK